MPIRPVASAVEADRIITEGFDGSAIVELYLWPSVGSIPQGEYHVAVENLDAWFDTAPVELSADQRAELRRIAFPPPSRPQLQTSGLPQRDIRDDAITALTDYNHPPTFFLQGGVVTEVAYTETHEAVLRPVSTTRMRDRLGEVADWVNAKGDHVRAPADIAAILRETPTLTLPPITGIVEVPVLRRDGGLTLRRGYDSRAKVFFHPSIPLGTLKVPDRPTRQDVLAALRFLDIVFGDFPWKDNADKVNALALMLTPVLRPLIDGPVPLAAITAPKAGTGKTLLVDSIVGMLSGKPTPVVRLGADEDEATKRVTSKLLKGPQFIVLDNVDGKLDSGVLAEVLTARVWSARIIGTSNNPDIPVTCTWAATGNNLTLNREIGDRSYLIRLDAGVDRPRERPADIFRVWREYHMELTPWIADNRPALLSAILTIVQAWVNAGMPPGTGTVLGSFESWSRVVGGVLTVAWPDFGREFLSNRDALQVEHEDDDAEAGAMFAESLYQLRRSDWFTVRDLLTTPNVNLAWPLEAFDPTDRDATKDLGTWFRDHRGTTLGQYKIELGDRMRTGRAYRVTV
jgi:hypothetical protein